MIKGFLVLQRVFFVVFFFFRRSLFQFMSMVLKIYFVNFFSLSEVFWDFFCSFRLFFRKCWIFVWRWVLFFFFGRQSRVERIQGADFFFFVVGGGVMDLLGFFVYFQFLVYQIVVYRFRYYWALRQFDLGIGFLERFILGLFWDVNILLCILMFLLIRVVLNFRLLFWWLLF